LHHGGGLAEFDQLHGDGVAEDVGGRAGAGERGRGETTGARRPDNLTGDQERLYDAITTGPRSIGPCGRAPRRHPGLSSCGPET